MYLLPKEIKENALFIADAHYPHHGDSFLNILKALKNKSIETPQLFLMGDIFDLLFGHNEYIKTFSKEGIELLQQLSQKIEIFYIEGNHDFCLQELFPNITVYKREEQPVHFTLNSQNIYLSHGDRYTAGVLYNVYSTLLRNKKMLTLLKFLRSAYTIHHKSPCFLHRVCSAFFHTSRLLQQKRQIKYISTIATP